MYSVYAKLNQGCKHIRSQVWQVYKLAWFFPKEDQLKFSYFTFHAVPPVWITHDIGDCTILYLRCNYGYKEKHHLPLLESIYSSTKASNWIQPVQLSVATTQGAAERWKQSTCITSSNDPSAEKTATSVELQPQSRNCLPRTQKICHERIQLIVLSASSLHVSAVADTMLLT